MQEIQILRQRIRLLIWFFIIMLILSGITAFPIETQLEIAMKNLDKFPLKLQRWLTFVYDGISDTNRKYPFISYGTDWLAFAHLVIAVAFIGPLRDPVRNIWVLQFGMIACCMVLPLALIAGSIRGIPFYWQLLDCSFGIIGFVPLWICYRMIQRLGQMEPSKFN